LHITEIISLFLQNVLNSKFMQTYEFNTVVHNGFIQIPKQLIEKKISDVRVILVVEPAKIISEPCKKRFTAMRLKTKGLTFNREELYERECFS